MRSKKGIVLTLTALLIPIIIGYGAFVIDLAQAYTIKVRVKSAIDLATLAGISQLTDLSDLTDAKLVALSALNNNLSTALPGFMALTLSSPSLSIQGGVFDFSTKTFAWNEATSEINSIKVSYTYTSMTLLSTLFNINTVTVSGFSTAAKQSAGYMPPGTGFPLVIKANEFCSDLMGLNMIILDNGMAGNSWWTAFDAMGGTSEVIDILWYWQYGFGTPPGGLSVGEDFKDHLGNDNSVWMNLDPDALEDMIYIFPVGSDIGGNMIRTDGFIAGTITEIDPDMQELHIDVIPGYINNQYGGTFRSIGANESALCGGGSDYLSQAYTLVQ